MRMIFRCDPALSDHLPRRCRRAARCRTGCGRCRQKRIRKSTAATFAPSSNARPLSIAMAYGVTILLPCDITVERGAFSWAWDIPEPQTTGHPRAPLSFHVAAQFSRCAVRARWRGRDQVQQLLDHRTGTWLVAVRHPPGQSRRPAVPPDHRAWSMPIAFMMAASIFRRCGPNPISPVCCPGARRWRSASRCRATRRNWCSKVSMGRTARPMRRRSVRCWPSPASTANAFAPGAGDQPPSDWSSDFRSAASSSHSRPCDPEVSAIAMVPKLAGAADRPAHRRASRRRCRRLPAARRRD